MILHFQQDSFRFTGNPDRNISPTIRIFKGIRNDIYQHLLYLIDIYVNVQFVNIGREPVMNLLLFGNTGKVVENFPYHTDQIYLTQNQFHLIVVDSSEIEYLVDNPVEPVYIPFHQSHVFLNRRIKLGVLYQFIDRSKYQCKRSTDFMGDIGKKL